MRLSHDLAPLAVSGNKIVDAQTGQPVILRGVNRSGLEYSSPDGVGSLVKAGITATELSEIIQNWGANIIRLPFNQEWARATEDYDASGYRNALETVIELAASLGAYTLLDLQWLDAATPRGTTNGKLNFVAPLPNTESLSLWQQLAGLWRDEPAVLYEIFNEPHDALPDDNVPLLGIEDDGSTFLLPGRTVGMAEWQPWARQLVMAIRSQNPDALIFVPGMNWAYDLRGYPAPGIDDVVYSTHVYVAKGTDWDGAFGNLADAVPVFAGEWGGGDADLDWGLRLAQYFDDRDMGWTAWSWSDDPHLVEFPPQPPYRATRFGSVVRSALATTRKY